MSLQTHLCISHQDAQGRDLEPTVEVLWRRVVIGAEFTGAVRPENATLLEKIVALQEAPRLARHHVDMSGFLALLADVVELAARPPWQVGRGLRLAKGEAHPDLPRYEELQAWLQAHAGGARTFIIEHYDDTNGYGDAGPRDVRL